MQTYADTGVNVIATSGRLITGVANGLPMLPALVIVNVPPFLGVHAIEQAPVIDESGAIVAGHVMYLSVSIDHRIVDGATGARWMNVVKACLEEPTRLLFEAV